MNPASRGARARSVPRHRRPAPDQDFLFGVACYPEHWTKREWRRDFALMARSGVKVVRMGEFAAPRFPHVPGEFAHAHDIDPRGTHETDVAPAFGGGPMLGIVGNTEQETTVGRRAPVTRERGRGVHLQWVRSPATCFGLVEL